MAGVKEISQGFASRPGRGTPKSGRLFRQTHSAPGKTPPRQKYGRPYLPAESFPPQECPRTRQKEKSPEKIWQEEGKFPSMACALPFPLRSRNMPRSRGICGTDVCRKKAPPGEKPVAEHAAAQEAPEKKSPQALTSCRSARNARQRRKKQRNTGGGNLALPGEQKNFQRLAHGTGKKLAMEKEADQMRRIAPRHRKEKTPCPRITWPE